MVGVELLSLKERVVERFSKENWLEVGLLTGATDLMTRHPRLFRSMDWGDPDYPTAALEVLIAIAQMAPSNETLIEKYLQDRFEQAGENISSAPRPGRTIVFQPNVFVIPEDERDSTLVAVMMPFAREFDPVYAAIQQASGNASMKCQRVSDLWEHSAVMQDIFTLIYRSSVVVCDFSGRNSNVFYEAGIAHTLGRHVVPITQHKGDVPFDLQAHRYLPYLNNSEGLAAMSAKLSERLRFLQTER